METYPVFIFLCLNDCFVLLIYLVPWNPSGAEQKERNISYVMRSSSSWTKLKWWVSLWSQIKSSPLCTIVGDFFLVVFVVGVLFWKSGRRRLTDCKSTAMQHKGLSHLLFIAFLLASHLHVLRLHFQIPQRHFLVLVFTARCRWRNQLLVFVQSREGLCSQ